MDYKKNMANRATSETSTSTNNGVGKKSTAFSPGYSIGISDKDSWYVDSGPSDHFTVRSGCAIVGHRK